jgi:hypothetical protein
MTCKYTSSLYLAVVVLFCPSYTFRSLSFPCLIQHWCVVPIFVALPQFIHSYFNENTVHADGDLFLLQIVDDTRNRLDSLLPRCFIERFVVTPAKRIPPSHPDSQAANTTRYTVLSVQHVPLFWLRIQTQHNTINTISSRVIQLQLQLQLCYT